MSQHGGLTQTVAAMVRRGWLSDTYALTSKGHALCDQLGIERKRK